MSTIDFLDAPFEILQSFVFGFDVFWASVFGFEFYLRFSFGFWPEGSQALVLLLKNRANARVGVLSKFELSVTFAANRCSLHSSYSHCSA